MKRHVYRRWRSWSFRLIACVHHRREAAGDGRARTAILVAQAIAGCVPGGMGAGRKWMWPPSEWTAGMWRQCCHGGGEVTDVANPVDDEIQPSGGAIGTPRPGWK